MANVTVIQPTISDGQAEKIRCAAYCRVSSSSDDQLNSFAVQMSYYNQKFEHSDTEMLVDVYADEGISGTVMTKRGEFNRMLADCRRGKIDRIYTKSISRFARNTRDCLKVVRELKSLGITIKFEKEGYDTAQMTDEIMLTVMGSLAQEESVSISQNMRWSVQKRFADGSYLLAVPPYGYRYDGKVLIIHEEEATVVRRIFAWYLSGMGLTRITDALNRQNTPRNGNHTAWNISTVRYILTNERYIGDARFQKSYHTNALPFPKVPNRGELQQYYVTDANPAIIEKSDFIRVQELLAERAEKRPHKKIESSLTGKARCGCCGTMLGRKMINGKAYWICRKHNRAAAQCPLTATPENDIYTAFIRLHQKLQFGSKYILVPLLHSLQDLKEKQCCGNTDAIALHREIAKLLEQSHVIARLRTKGFLTDQKYAEQSAELNTKIANLHMKQKKMYANEAADEQTDQIELLISHFANQQNPMTAFDSDIFSMMVEKITVTAEHDIILKLIGGLQFTEKNHAL